MSTTQSDQPREIIEKLFQAWTDHDNDGAIDLYDENVVQEWPFAPAGVPKRIEGREPLRARRHALAKLHAEYGLKSEYRAFTWYETTDPEVVIVEFEAAGETTVTGPFVRQYIYVFRVRDGRIVLFRDYADPAMTEAFAAKMTAVGEGTA